MWKRQRGRDGDLQYEIKPINAREKAGVAHRRGHRRRGAQAERSLTVQLVTIAQMVQYVRKLEQSSGARVTNVIGARRPGQLCVRSTALDVAGGGR